MSEFKIWTNKRIEPANSGTFLDLAIGRDVLWSPHFSATTPYEYTVGIRLLETFDPKHKISGYTIDEIVFDEIPEE